MADNNQEPSQGDSYGTFGETYYSLGCASANDSLAAETRPVSIATSQSDQTMYQSIPTEAHTLPLNPPNHGTRESRETSLREGLLQHVNTRRSPSKESVESPSHRLIQPSQHYLRKWQNYVPPKMHDLTPNASMMARADIRTDRVTGNRYRRMRSLSESVTTDGKLQYEKEVYSSSTIFSTMPRVDSYSVMPRETIQKFLNRQTKKKESEEQEEMKGYSWLGKSVSWKDQVLEAAANVWHNQAIALFILALFVTCIAFVVSQITEYCWQLTDMVYNSGSNALFTFIGALAIKLAFVLGAITLTVVVAPQAAGSGIPELKAILSGIWIRRYLSIRCFFVKIAALTLALGSGLPIGVEGPFIHISAIVGRQLTRMGMFTHLDRKMLLSAACACSIAVIFDAPIGGVLFSIEVTHHYYKVNSYWSAFVCAVIAAVFLDVVTSIVPTTLLLLHTSFTETPYHTYEFIVFGTLGIVAGFCAAGYVAFHRYVAHLKMKYRAMNHKLANPYILATSVTIIYLTATFFLGEFAFGPSRQAISDLFNADALKTCTDSCQYNDWNSGLGVYWNLFFFSILNFIFSAIMLVFDWPCGCFAAIFAIGAASGRLLGEVLNDSVMHMTDARLVAATYAVVGAASLVGGVTRSISVAVIAIEMTNQVSLAVPTLLGVILAWTIASWLSDSLYDSMLELRGIPLLPVAPRNPTNLHVSPPRPYTAADIMITHGFPYLNEKATLREIAFVLAHFTEVFFPVIQNNRRTLIGEVSRQVLEDTLKARGLSKGSEARQKLIQLASDPRTNLDPITEANEERYPSAGQIPDADFDEDRFTNDEDDDTVYESLLTQSNYASDSGDGDDENDHTTMFQKTGKTVRMEPTTDELARSMANEAVLLTDDRYIVHLNLSPVQVIPNMPISKIYVLFHILHPDKIYVTNKNELIGVIDESVLIQRERKHQDPANSDEADGAEFQAIPVLDNLETDSVTDDIPGHELQEPLNAQHSRW